MSYSSRVYRQRNAHTHDESKKETFFSKQNDINKSHQPGTFFQAKLTVNQPGDSYEQEADSVASAVVNKTSAGPIVQHKKISSIQRLATSMEDEKLSTNDARMAKDKEIQEKPIQRMTDVPEKEKSEDIQKTELPGKDEKENIQKKEDSGMEEDDKLKREPIQTKTTGNTTTASPHVTSKIESTSGKGNVLPAKTKTEMSSSFGVDFSGVRIHKDSEAVNLNKELQAQAFTRGNDIYFNEGKFDPDTKEGKFLLAHELTHVVQQSSDINRKENYNNVIQRAPIFQGTIMDEGSCAHLACNSKWACEDDENGVMCPKGTRNAGTNRRPLFTCDTNCDTPATCSDTANWMAMPGTKFSRKKCGQNLVICANNTFTHAIVRDRSETKKGWEVSHGVQDDLGVSPLGNFKGSIYGDETDPQFLKDSKCR